MIVVLKQWIDFDRFKELGLPIDKITAIIPYTGTKSEVQAGTQVFYVLGTVHEVADHINATLSKAHEQTIRMEMDTKPIEAVLSEHIQTLRANKLDGAA